MAGEVEMGGTIRSLTRPGYRFIDEKVQSVLHGAAAVGNCKLNLTVSSLEYDCLSRPAPEGAPGGCTFPPTVNEPGAYRLAKGAAVGLVGADRCVSPSSPPLNPPLDPLGACFEPTF